jgi:formyl-CoA transferase
MFAALGIVAALNHRLRTGRGQHVGTSLIGASAALLSSYVTSQALGTPFDRVGSAHNTLAPYQAFRGCDAKFFIVAAGNDRFFARLAGAVGRPGLSDDPRYLTNAQRSHNREELAEELQQVFDSQPARHWIELLDSAGVPVSPIYDLAEMIVEDQMRLNGYIIEVDQPGIGRLPMVATPVTFSATPVSVRRHAPGLDENRDEILGVVEDPQRW